MSATEAAEHQNAQKGRRSVLRLIFFTAIWIVLTRADGDAWAIGAPAVLLATLASLQLRSRVYWHWRLPGVLRFIPYFLWHSLLGGIDVTRRALHPSLPLDPALVYHPLRLAPGPARVFLANTINLLPGTLSAELADGWLIVHLLDARLSNVMELQRVEEHVAALFGIALAEREENGRG
jgi:multicomponent Na+:H+ antiporter subunit E